MNRVVSCREDHISRFIGVLFHVSRSDIVTMLGQIYPLGFALKRRQFYELSHISGVSISEFQLIKSMGGRNELF